MSNSAQSQTSSPNVKDEKPHEMKDSSHETEAQAREEKVTTVEPKKLGRKGDPRMHRSVAARLANPEMTLLEALKAGGFDTSSENPERGVDGKGVTLSQRKNQLSRRLRFVRQGQQKKSQSKGSNKGDKAGEEGANASKPSKDSSTEEDSNPIVSINNKEENSGRDGSETRSKKSTQEALAAVPLPINKTSLAAAQAAAVQAIKTRAEDRGKRKRRLSQDKDYTTDASTTDHVKTEKRVSSKRSSLSSTDSNDSVKANQAGATKNSTLQMLQQSMSGTGSSGGRGAMNNSGSLGESDVSYGGNNANIPSEGDNNNGWNFNHFGSDAASNLAIAGNHLSNLNLSSAAAASSSNQVQASNLNLLMNGSNTSSGINGTANPHPTAEEMFMATATGKLSASLLRKQEDIQQLQMLQSLLGSRGNYPFNLNAQFQNVAGAQGGGGGGVLSPSNAVAHHAALLQAAGAGNNTIASSILNPNMSNLHAGLSNDTGDANAAAQHNANMLAMSNALGNATGVSQQQSISSSPAAPVGPLVSENGVVNANAVTSANLSLLANGQGHSTVPTTLKNLQTPKKKNKNSKDGGDDAFKNRRSSMLSNVAVVDGMLSKTDSVRVPGVVRTKKRKHHKKHKKAHHHVEDENNDSNSGVDMDELQKVCDGNTPGFGNDSMGSSISLGGKGPANNNNTNSGDHDVDKEESKKQSDDKSSGEVPSEKKRPNIISQDKINDSKRKLLNGNITSNGERQEMNEESINECLNLEHRNYKTLSEICNRNYKVVMKEFKFLKR
mmetsp:Transcript_21588/g.31613  ORF Transcript_21588/g.31613 Transcript_21588/m.31613 type:complete len:780 (+) Transcript_21588:325-2664(+)